MHFYHQEAILPIRVASEHHEPRILESLQEILKPAVNAVRTFYPFEP